METTFIDLFETTDSAEQYETLVLMMNDFVFESEFGKKTKNNEQINDLPF